MAEQEDPYNPIWTWPPAARQDLGSVMFASGWDEASVLLWALVSKALAVVLEQPGLIIAELVEPVVRNDDPALGSEGGQ